MHFTKALVLLTSALAPVAFAAKAAPVTKTLTLVPTGYTPPVSTSSSSTSTPMLTSTPLSTSTPMLASTPYSSSTFSVTPSSSTPLVKAISTPFVVDSSTQSSAPAPASSTPTSGGASLQLPGVVAAGVMVVAGYILV